MTGYATRNQHPPSLSLVEQARLLQVSGAKRDDYRDHMIFSVAMGTALREHEIVALNVGHVYDGAKILRRMRLHTFKGAPKPKPRGRPATQDAFVPDALAHKLVRFLAWKTRAGEGTAKDAPLFCARREGRAVARWSSTQGRMSTRTIRYLFTLWQERARFDQHYPFHVLRHTAVTNLYRATGDVRMAQRFARHANLATTQIYAHVDDDQLFAVVRRLPA